MFNKLLSATLFCIVSQLSFAQNSLSIPLGSENVLTKAQEAISAYQNDDSTVWTSVMCSAAKNEAVFGLKAVQAILQKISSPRLVLLSTSTTAKNDHLKAITLPHAYFEVTAEGYPLGKLLLKFTEDSKNNCIFVIF